MSERHISCTRNCFWRFVSLVIFFESYVVKFLIILNVYAHYFTLRISLFSCISHTGSGLQLLGIVDSECCRSTILLIKYGLHLRWRQRHNRLLGIQELWSAAWDLLSSVILLLFICILRACLHDRLTWSDMYNRWLVLFLGILLGCLCDSCFEHWSVKRMNIKFIFI